MAEDKKTDQNLDDWDKLLLDPAAADDWDDIPPPTDQDSAPPAEAAEAPPLSDDDDFDAPAPPNGENSAAPPLLTDDDDFDAPPTPEAPFLTDDDDDFDAPAPDGNDDKRAGAAGDEEAPPPDSLGPDTIPMKKVELDTADLFLEEEQAEEPEAPPDVERTPDETPPTAEDAPAEAEPGSRKIPRLKLLLIVLPAVLLLAAAALGAYTFFFTAPEPENVPPPLRFSPDLPDRAPVSGEMDLASFYINFPGRPHDTVVEVLMTLHYDDVSAEAVIREKLTAVRDIIYRVTQGRGSRLITDAGLQRSLREELRERANLALGGPYVSYVQIDQIRILQ